MPIDDERKENPERKLPAQAALYEELNKRLPLLIAEAQRQIYQATGKEAEPLTGVLFRNERVPLELHSVGVEEAVFHNAGYGKFFKKEGGRFGSDIVMVDLELYQDGSPYVIEGDDMDSKSVTDYQILMGRELPPTLVQVSTGAKSTLIAEEWYKANKHVLTPDDCQSLLDCLPNLIPDTEAEIDVAEFPDESNEE